MVSTIMKSVLAVTIVLGFATSVFAIRCYQCESITSPKCGYPFEGDDNQLIDCSRIGPPRYLQNFFPVRNATGCMKKTLDSVIGRPQIVRTCYFGDISNTAIGCQSDPTLPFVKQLSCDVCTGDKCNSATSMTPIAGSAILLFFGVARLLS